MIGQTVPYRNYSIGEIKVSYIVVTTVLNKFIFVQFCEMKLSICRLLRWKQLELGCMRYIRTMSLCRT